MSGIRQSKITKGPVFARLGLNISTTTVNAEIISLVINLLTTVIDYFRLFGSQKFKDKMVQFLEAVISGMV